MPYCPTCRTEYRSDKSTCGDCGAELVDSLPGDDQKPLGERVDVFVSFREQQVNRVVALLQEGGVDGMVRFRGSSAFPMNVGTQNEHIVAVLVEDVPRAVELITVAVKDQFIDDDGRLLVSGPAESPE